jgi:hypothetical protein
LDRELYQTAKELDPSRLCLHQDGGTNSPENSDFQSGPVVPWAPGDVKANVPFVAHEYLNLGVFFDPRLEPRFKGEYVSPRSMKDYEEALQAVGLERAWGDACLDAGHRLQHCYQKRGIESARIDPACGGYDYWALADVLVQQTGQGLYNPFMEPKPGGATPEAFCQFNGPTALLMRSDPECSIAVAGQKIHCDWWISHFGDMALKAKNIAWRLCAGGESLAAGKIENVDVAIGDVRKLGACEIAVPELQKPVHAVLEATVDGTDVKNQWDFWLFPKHTAKSGEGLAATEDLYKALASRYPGLALAGTPEGKAAKTLLTPAYDSDAIAAIESGRRVFVIEPPDPKPNVSLGWWWIGDQTGTAMLPHPVFGEFPHDGFLSPLWFRIVKVAPPLKPDDKLRNMEPLMLGEGGQGYYVYLSQACVGQGRLLRACGLDLLADQPEQECLLDAMLDYVKSEAFAPKRNL